MLDAEIAAVMKFVQTMAAPITPYYDDILENFAIPSVFFPQPEVTPEGDTSVSYALEYSMYIKFFGSSTSAAYDKAFTAFQALLDRRNLIPVYKQDGSLSGTSIRLKDPSLKPVDDGVVQLTVKWRSSRPYIQDESQKMMRFEIEGWMNPDVYVEETISVAFSTAINNYLHDYPNEVANAGEYP